MVRPSRRSGTSPAVLAIVLAAALGAALALALLGPAVAPRSATEIVGVPFTRDPGGASPLGTDHLGRDVLSRLLHGGRSLVLVPLAGTVLATVLGGTLGVLAASTGRRPQTVLSRCLDVLIVLPPVLVLLVLLNTGAPRTLVLVATIVLVTTPFAARYARAAAEPLLHTGYVEHELAAGGRLLGVLVRDVVPNLAGPLLADTGLRYVGAVYLTASAGFLGYGPAGAGADWGSMIAENMPGAGLNVLAVLAPCAALVLFTVSANLLADRLAHRWAR
jgi:peptide/nickel transport system permease protein